MKVIRTRGLTKVYAGHLGRGGVRSLDSLDLDIGENEVFGFLGHNGAGKTTTIKILCGLLRATDGEAFVFGKNVRERAARMLMGYLPENPYFYEYLTPKETIHFYGQLYGLSTGERDKEWDKLSELLNLREIGEQRVVSFSKGMRQRLGFAVALVGDPKLLILDEPMSGLDPLGRRAIRELIMLLRDEKKTIFFSSHVLGDVEQVCDRVGILVNGKLMVKGLIDELLARRIHKVEVIGQNLSDEDVQTISGGTDSVRKSEAGHHFYMDTVEEANTVVLKIQSCGGLLAEFIPIKETLEDYFMHMQEAKK